MMINTAFRYVWRVVEKDIEMCGAEKCTNQTCYYLTLFCSHRDKIHFHDHKFEKHDQRAMRKENSFFTSQKSEIYHRRADAFMPYFHYPHMLPASFSLSLSHSHNVCVFCFIFLTIFRPRYPHPKISFYYTHSPFYCNIHKTKFIGYCMMINNITTVKYHSKAFFSC
jgi:hypothetical protein